jgi:indole-3-glycerol phosphate synthase
MKDFSLSRMRGIKSEGLERLRSLTTRLPARTRPLHSLERNPSGISIIAEVKKSSPSAGAIRTVDASEQAHRYIAGGATALSVLTDDAFFGGSFDDLAEVCTAADVPVLCKEFIYFKEQIDCAYAHGADMALLIARTLSVEELGELYRHTMSLGMLPIMEVHHMEELENVLALRPSFIMVNSRNLETLAIGRTTAAITLSAIPEGITTIYASGIETRFDIGPLHHGFGVSYFLVGTALMRAQDPSASIRELCNVH